MSPARLLESTLAQRWLSAAVGLPVLVGVCVWGVTPFVVLTVILALLARFEMTRAYARRQIRPNGLLSLMGALMPATVLLLPVPFDWGMPATSLPFLLFLACGLIAASLWETGTASHADHVHAGRNLAYGLLCGAYVSLFTGVALLAKTVGH
jgi:CDP-diglyceride synthetase